LSAQDEQLVLVAVVVEDDYLSRFPNAASLKGYAGTAPITITSGKYWGTHVRWAGNKRLQYAAFLWANRALLDSAGPGSTTTASVPRARPTPRPSGTCPAAASSAASGTA